jgi:hypothetical protein
MKFGKENELKNSLKVQKIFLKLIKINLLNYYSGKISINKETYSQIAPSLVEFEGKKFLISGGYNEKSKSNILISNIDLETGKIENSYLPKIINEKDYANYSGNGIIPTSGRYTNNGFELLASTFKLTNSKTAYRIKPAVFKFDDVTKSVIFKPHPIDEGLGENYLICGSASFSMENNEVEYFAIAEKAILCAGRLIPASRIFQLTRGSLKPVELHDEQTIGFTRPIEYTINQSKYLFVSSRQINGSYIQKVYSMGEVINEVNFMITGNFLNVRDNGVIYASPFKYRKTDLIFLSLDPLGKLGFYLGEIVIDN